MTVSKIRRPTQKLRKQKWLALPDVNIDWPELTPRPVKVRLRSCPLMALVSVVLRINADVQSIKHMSKSIMRMTVTPVMDMTFKRARWRRYGNTDEYLKSRSDNRQIGLDFGAPVTIVGLHYVLSQPVVRLSNRPSASACLPERLYKRFLPQSLSIWNIARGRNVIGNVRVNNAFYHWTNVHF